MAQRRKRRSAKNRRKKSQDDYPGWVWMLFGLAIGLAVAFAVYVKDREPPAIVAEQPAERQQPASLQSALDDNGESPAPVEPKDDRFDFYEMLTELDFVVEKNERDSSAGSSTAPEPLAIEEPGEYLLQAGSFSTPQDADRRKAELALHGIESYVQRARVNGRDYYRVNIGPTRDLNTLNVTRSRLRAAQIDVLRIRVGD